MNERDAVETTATDLIEMIKVKSGEDTSEWRLAVKLDAFLTWVAIVAPVLDVGMTYVTASMGDTPSFGMSMIVVVVSGCLKAVLSSSYSSSRAKVKTAASAAALNLLEGSKQEINPMLSSTLDSFLPPRILDSPPPSSASGGLRLTAPWPPAGSGRFEAPHPEWVPQSVQIEGEDPR